MRRRQALQTVGFAMLTLGGCVSALPRSTPTMTPSESTPTGYWRWVTITNSQHSSERYQVEMSVDITRPWITSEETAHIQVTLKNLANEKRRIGPVVNDPEFPTDGVNGIILFDETGASDSSPPNCIGATGKSDSEVGYGGGRRLPHRIDAKESVTRTIKVFDDPNVVGCIPAGKYPFHRKILVMGPEDDLENAPSYQWDFTLGVRGRESD